MVGLESPYPMKNIEHRASGILLHITSLPSKYGVGDLGPTAYAFVDFLAKAGQKYWQILPLNPTTAVLGNSPYSSFSGFAGNPLLISPEILAQDGFCRLSDIQEGALGDCGPVDYEKAAEYKENLLEKVFEAHEAGLKNHAGFQKFLARNNPHWLDAFALFNTLKKRFDGAPWNCWPATFRDREAAELEACEVRAAQEILREKFIQYLFFTQWARLKEYCAQKGVRVIGDLPFYPTCDSADVWENTELFKLDKNQCPLVVAGVPPDYFSETGQYWGNPVYQWDVLQQGGYHWWMRRIRHNLEMFDTLRLDHFRGFAAHFEIQALEKTAVNGRWIKGPGEDFFHVLARRFPKLPFIAEDLGHITEDVIALREKFGLPGMRLLQFSFDKDIAENQNAPHNHSENCVVYTGTHDNNTVRGWYESEATKEDKQRLELYLGHSTNEDQIAADLVRLCMMSPARTAIFPLQDILGLSRDARMNTPSTAKGNWRWRVSRDQLSPELATKLKGVSRLFGRA
ncbi:MAG: 4-alpha-glucanotransferase [Thermodesulfobacteriota bacterium]|nr:4-alpha-glucanotransferase [Thermodesulfobacteriota bacterium]